MHLYKKYDGEDTMTTLIAMVLTALMVLIYLAYIGFIFQTMWGWFVVPLGAPPLVLPQATGIVLMVTLPFVRPTRRDDRELIYWSLLIYPLFALLLGYVFHLMM